jgi:hypothetical protein
VPHACAGASASRPFTRIVTSEDTGGLGGLSALLGTEKEWSSDYVTSEADEEEDEEEEEGGSGAEESGGEGEGPSAAAPSPPPQQQHHLPQRFRSPRAPPRPRAATVSPPARGGDAAAAGAAGDAAPHDGPPLGAALDAGEGESPADLIARRTRAHVSLVDFDMETLEQCLMVRTCTAWARPLAAPTSCVPQTLVPSAALRAPRALACSLPSCLPPCRPACHRHTPAFACVRAQPRAARPPAHSATPRSQFSLVCFPPKRRVRVRALQLDDEADFLFDDSDEYADFLATLQAPWPPADEPVRALTHARTHAHASHRARSLALTRVLSWPGRERRRRARLFAV